MTMIPIVFGALVMVLKNFEKGTGRVGNHSTNRDHLNYCMVEISQNTEKGPGDMRRIAVTQSPVKDNQLTLV